MSEEKLNFQQKLFAVVEGLVRETKVREIHLHMSIPVEALSFDIEAVADSLDFSITAGAKSLDTGIRPQVTGIIDSFLQSRVTDAAISALEPVVKDENVSAVRDTAVHDAGIRLTTEITDFFSRFKVTGNVKYTTAVKSVDLSNLKVNKPRSLNIGIYQRRSLQPQSQ
jgi:hypothetical protein